MSATPRFTIQREDDTWYAGQSDGGAVRWIGDPQDRHEFMSEREAWGVLQQLQKAGLRVMLYEILGERQAGAK